MEGAGFVVDHASTHWDGVAEDFVGDPELRKGMNPAGGKREVDGASPHGVPRTRIGPAFVEIDLVTALPEEGAEQSAREPATNESEPGRHEKILEPVFVV
jgi:hypothetical protein